jgi:quercetin dioxygenase-like cupin family protein
MTVLEKLQGISSRLDTVSQLIEAGQLIRERGIVKSETAYLETVYDKDASVSVGEAEVGEVFPMHVHQGVLQYLICVSGKFVVNFRDPAGYRILNAKECVSVTPNTLHSVTALISGSKLVSICIPVEPAYTCA